MNTDPVTVKRMEWLRIFPVLHLWHAARMAFCVRTLIPMFLAFVLVWIGVFQICQFTDSIPLDEEMYLGILSGESHLLKVFPWAAVQPSDSLSAPSLRANVATVASSSFPAPIEACVLALTSIVTESDNLQRDVGVLALIPALLLIFFVAAARSTATEFCTQTRTGAIASLRLAVVSLPKSLLATVLAAVLIAIPVGLLHAVSWLAAPSGFGESFAMFAWPVITLLAAIAGLTSVVVSTAWLLSLAAIGTDRCAGADALSRSINYVLSHKLRTFCYLSIVTMVSKLAWLLTHSVLLTANGLLEPRFREFIPVARRALESKATAPQQALHWWQAAINIGPEVAEFGAFVSGITLMYILLRQREDAVDLRELDGGRKS